MSVPARLNPIFRALTLFGVLPPEHVTFGVQEDGADPHLREGEFAVIDTTDRAAQHGELYVIQYDGLDRPRKLVQLRAAQLNITGRGAEPSLCWWVSDLRGFRRKGDYGGGGNYGGIPEYTGLSDGPYTTEDLERKLIGRVVGYSVTVARSATRSEGGKAAEGAGNSGRFIRLRGPHTV
jgi:hypothetical protein